MSTSSLSLCCLLCLLVLSLLLSVCIPSVSPSLCSLLILPSLAGTETVFWGKVYWSLGPEGWRMLSELKFFAGDRRCFLGQKCDKVLVGQVGGQMILHIELWYFFTSYKLAKIVTVTMLLLFGHVTLLCGKFLFINLSEGPVSLSIHTSSVTALILPPEADQRRSEISPLTASETFIQRRRRRIGVGSLHANSSVNGATVIRNCLQVRRIKLIL